MLPKLWKRLVSADCRTESQNHPSEGTLILFVSELCIRKIKISAESVLMHFSVPAIVLAKKSLFWCTAQRLTRLFFWTLIVGQH